MLMLCCCLFGLVCILQNLGLALLRGIIMCKLIQEVTFFGWIVLSAPDVPGKVILVYVMCIHAL